MKITPSSGQSGRGPADWFTGTALIDTVRKPDDQSAIGCAHLRFTPGARTAWHTHPKGQTLYVTDGIGLVNRRGGEPVEIRPGDVVYIEPGEEHWYGATPGRFMARLAMQEADDQGRVVTWLDHVADEDYSSMLERRLAAPVSRAGWSCRVAAQVRRAVGCSCRRCPARAAA